MPDITMCKDETCPLKGSCYRHPASGTEPSEHRQSFFASKPLWSRRRLAGQSVLYCPYYWGNSMNRLEKSDAAGQ